MNNVIDVCTWVSFLVIMVLLILDSQSPRRYRRPLIVMSLALFGIGAYRIFSH